MGWAAGDCDRGWLGNASEDSFSPRMVLSSIDLGEIKWIQSAQSIRLELTDHQDTANATNCQLCPKCVVNAIYVVDETTASEEVSLGLEVSPAPKAYPKAAISKRGKARGAGESSRRYAETTRRGHPVIGRVR